MDPKNARGLVLKDEDLEDPLRAGAGVGGHDDDRKCCNRWRNPRTRGVRWQRQATIVRTSADARCANSRSMRSSAKHRAIEGPGGNLGCATNAGSEGLGPPAVHRAMLHLC